jgi:hypothetical protein
MVFRDAPLLLAAHPGAGPTALVKAGVSMILSLRILLIAGAVLTFVFFIVQIRRKRLLIDYALFWLIFGALLLVIALFPGIVTATSDALGFISPANFVFLGIIFVLLLRLFSVTMKLSRLSRQIEDVTQRLALVEQQKEDQG